MTQAASGIDLFIPEVYDIVWSLIILVIVAVFFYKFFMPKFNAIFDERAAKIQGNNEKRLVTHEIAQRLDDLEAARHLTQREVAAGIGMIEQTYSNKKNGLRPFSAKDYKALADFFDTSVDYLMGRTLDPWPADNPQPEEAAK